MDGAQGNRLNLYQRWDIGFENIFSGILEDIYNEQKRNF